MPPNRIPNLKPLFLVPIFVCMSWSVLSAQNRPAPIADTEAPNLPAQPLGANDLISVSVYDAPELTRTVRVSSDGFIRLPMLKQRIKVQDLLPAELEAAIAQALRGEQILVDPIVTVTVAEYISRPISVAGAVKQPLTFQAGAPVTLLEAITRAGGLAPEAGPVILVSRTQAGPDGISKAMVERIPVKGLIDGADPFLNIVLKGGEEVRVPEAGKVYVIGNIKMPGAYAVGDGADSSVLKILAQAQGLTPFPAKEAYIYRREGNGGKNEIPIELSKIMDRKTPDVPLFADDILYVPDNKGRRMTIGALQKALLISVGMGAAALYIIR
jgi:polysaccharide export outer membrane protein